MLPVLRDPITFEILITNFMSHIFTQTLPRLAQEGRDSRINYVVGLDARGFLIGPVIAQRLGAGFVPVRKHGKLPGECVQATFAKEYGEDVFEMQKGAIPAGANVLIVDDLIATGGSASAAGQLVQQQQANTVEYLFIVSIPFLGGAKKLDAPEYQYVSRAYAASSKWTNYAPTDLVATVEHTSASTACVSCCWNALVSCSLYVFPTSFHRRESGASASDAIVGASTPATSVPSTSASMC